jgi:carbonic anhydrase
MQTHLLFIVVLLCSWIAVHQAADDVKWDYHGSGPDIWKYKFSACRGQSQSPINIMTPCTVYQPFPTFNLSTNYGLTQNFTLNNNGHGISAKLIDETQFPLTLTGGGLNGTYKFVNVHLHWGENFVSGSEHQV